MKRAISHRGPDGHGSYLDGPAALGHNRLAVIDIDGGHQPMASSADRHVIVFNGEIYNYSDIKRNFLSDRDLHTSSDTEVLLEYLSQGDSADLNKLNGMWAVALWDKSKRKLFLTRDRFGIKPLYWCIRDHTFLFASEIKALLAYAMESGELDPAAIPEYLLYRGVAGTDTMFSGIFECPPGHSMRIAPGMASPQIICWWRDDDTCDNDMRYPESSLDDVTSCIRSAVQARLVSDVPLGTYNSGGVDSSIVSRFVRDERRHGLHTFSVGFSDSDYDESQYADLVSQSIGSTHHKLIIDEMEYADSLEETIWFMDEPLHHAHTVQLLLLSAHTKKSVTVVLTGEGADELFGGYPRYQIPLLSARVTRIPKPARQSLAAVLRSIGRGRRLVKLLESTSSIRDAFINNSRFLTQSEVSCLPHVFPGGFRDQLFHEVRGYRMNDLEQALCYDRRTYLPTLLQRLDRTTMANGVEARVPFLDYRLLAMSKGLHQSSKIIPARENKVLLKKLACRYFPRNMIYRRKMGFDVPVAAWLRNRAGLGRYLDYLEGNDSLSRRFLGDKVVEQLVTEHLVLGVDRSALLWPLVNLEIWSRLFTCGTEELRRRAIAGK